MHFGGGTTLIVWDRSGAKCVLATIPSCCELFRNFAKPWKGDERRHFSAYTLGFAQPKEVMKTVRWTKPEVHEALATLYLRLNGYFTTGLILPSPEWGLNRTEVDCLAIRHPDHSQRERGVESSEFLAIRKGEVDLIICEVKSRPEEVTFNERPRTDLEVLRALLRWAGIFREEQIESVADRLQPLLQTGVALETVRNGVVEGRCRVRSLLCCPPCSGGDCADRWCLVGPELFHFVNQCFNPPAKRDTCSTRYNFLQWGYALAPLVDYFKNVKSGGTPNLADLYVHLRAS
jgi:hypothetical protein